MRIPTPSIPTAVILAMVSVVLAAAGLSALSGGAVPRVDVTVSVPPGGRLPSGGLDSLLVSLASSAHLEPRFFIVEGPAVYEWTADSSQPLIGSGTATYRISAPCSACSIPSGAMFIVRVYDVLSRTYSFSPTLRA